LVKINPMTLEQAKAKAFTLYKDGKWLQLAILIFQFGIELINYLRELKKNKSDDKTKNDTEGTSQATEKEAS